QTSRRAIVAALFLETMDFDPSSIPIPPSAPGPPPPPPGSSDAWANAAAALATVKKPTAPPPQSFAPSPTQPFPWLMQQYANGLANAAANDAYSYPQQQQQQNYPNWNPNAPALPANNGWNGTQNRLKNQFNQQKQWNQQGPNWQQNPMQQQQQGPQWGNNAQQQQQQRAQIPSLNSFKAFAFNKPAGGKLPHLQNSFVKQGGGPLDNGAQVCDKAPQFGNVPDSVRSFMERSLSAAPPADHEKVMTYLEARLRPLLQSGTHRFINWDKEPLPHMKNYELAKAWTPTAKNQPKVNPLSSPEKKPSGRPEGYSWAPTPKGSENRRRRRASSSSSSSDGRRSEKRGWYEDRQARSPSVEVTGEIKVRGYSGSSEVRWSGSALQSAHSLRVCGLERGTSRSGNTSRGGGVGVRKMVDFGVEKALNLCVKSSGRVEVARGRAKSRLQFISKKDKQKLLQREKSQKKDKQAKKKEKKNLHFEYADPHEISKKRDRMRRFAQDVIVAAPSVPYRPSRNQVVVGTSTEIEKKYFRLTAAPDPATVRPLHILKKSLEFVKEKYRNSAEYRYMCDLFRSIRQDLTVQRIRNSFTVEVYEIHARIALENADREEFNKCQSQLKVLYEEVGECANEPEFTAYRLLYSMAMSNSKDVTTILRSLTPAMREEKCVAYALRVRNKLTMGDQVGFFKLYESEAPLMCVYLLDLFVERERIAALNALVKAFRPTLPVSQVAKWLAMDEDEFVLWMEEKKYAKLRLGGELDCKALSAVTMA
ncbi:hypothetical protein PENTCL1PPCAC_13239, partial [Pristionchus entomophagus]